MAAAPPTLAASCSSANALLRRLAKTSLLAFGVQMSGVALTYLAQREAARLAGPASYGLYAYVTAIVVVVSYVAALGYDSALVRFLLAYLERGVPGTAIGLVAFVERRVLKLSLRIAAVGGLLVAAAATRLTPDSALTFLLGLVLIPVWALLLVRCAIIRAFGQAITALVPDRILRDGGLLALLGLATLASTREVGAPVVMAATILSSVAALAIATRRARRLCAACEGSPLDEEAPAWRRAAYPFLALVAAEVLINRCGVLLLGSTGQEIEAGCFALITNLAALVLLPRLAVNAYFTPLIARIYARGDLADLRALVAWSSLWSTLGALAVGVTVWLASPRLLAWYGPTFLMGRTALGILIAGQVIATSAGAQLQLLKMTGREIAAAEVLAGSLAVYVVLGLLLVPGWGLLGAAAANVAALLSWNGLMAPIVWRHLGIHPLPLPRRFTAVR